MSSFFTCHCHCQNLLRRGAEVAGRASFAYGRAADVAEWYEFLYKEKYSGEVYLELTFYSNVRVSPHWLTSA